MLSFLWKKKRFIENKDGTILDTATNLLWIKDNDYDGLNWDIARDYCETFTQGNYNDWRMPNIIELSTIYERKYSSIPKFWKKDSVNGREFEVHINPLFNLGASCCWSYEPADSDDDSASAWAFDYSDGSPCRCYLNSGSHTVRTLAVRGEELLAMPDCTEIDPLLKHAFLFKNKQAIGLHHKNNRKYPVLVVEENNRRIIYKNILMATRNNKVDIIIELLERGADINEKDYLGITALHSAIFDEKIDIINFLLDKGADVNSKNKYDESVLMYAVEMGDINIVKELIERGADINVVSEFGYTALKKSNKNDFTDITRFLIDNGAMNI